MLKGKNKRVSGWDENREKKTKSLLPIAESNPGQSMKA